MSVVAQALLGRACGYNQPAQSGDNPPSLIYTSVSAAKEWLNHAKEIRDYRARKRPILHNSEQHGRRVQVSAKGNIGGTVTWLPSMLEAGMSPHRQAYARKVKDNQKKVQRLRSALMKSLPHSPVVVPAPPRVPKRGRVSGTQSDDEVTAKRRRQERRERSASPPGSDADDERWNPDPIPVDDEKQYENCVFTSSLGIDMDVLAQWEAAGDGFVREYLDELWKKVTIKVNAAISDHELLLPTRSDRSYYDRRPLLNKWDNATNQLWESWQVRRDSGWGFWPNSGYKGKWDKVELTNVPAEAEAAIKPFTLRKGRSVGDVFLKYSEYNPRAPRQPPSSIKVNRGINGANILMNRPLILTIDGGKPKLCVLYVRTHYMQQERQAARRGARVVNRVYDEVSSGED